MSLPASYIAVVERLALVFSNHVGAHQAFRKHTKINSLEKLSPGLVLRWLEPPMLIEEMRGSRSCHRSEKIPALIQTGPRGPRFWNYSPSTSPEASRSTNS